VVGRANTLPAGIRTIAVPAFQNQTTTYRIEQRLTQAVVREFLTRTKYRIVADPEAADATVRGQIAGLDAGAVVFDPATGRDLAMLERELDATVGIASQSDDGALWVVGAARPDRPFAWHLLDRQSGKTTFLFAARPKLHTARLAPMQGVVITARDGLELVSYFTLPATATGMRPARPLPMVLCVHGGPWWRDSARWPRTRRW